MGSARLVPSGAFEAGSWQCFTLVYTAGRFGVDDTGSIKIGFRFSTDFRSDGQREARALRRLRSRLMAVFHVGLHRRPFWGRRYRLDKDRFPLRDRLPIGWAARGSCPQAPSKQAHGSVSRWSTPPAVLGSTIPAR